MTFNQWLIVSLIMIKNFRIFAPQDWNAIVNFFVEEHKKEYNNWDQGYNAPNILLISTNQIAGIS